MYVQDTISLRNWTFNLGIRGDIYNGLSTASQAEPRVGISYNIQKTNTVLRVSYARTLETPFNENLVLAANGCNDQVIALLVPCIPAGMAPGFRNEFHAGLQQAIGKYLVINGEYIWKYTHNSFDFSVLGNTPITFPINWHNSKIPGWALSASVPVYHGFSALVVMSSVAARFFPPQVGGLGTTVQSGGFPFRIDHDERFNQTMHLQYQSPKKFGPWIGFNWRYDSGLVAGAVPCYGIQDFNDCPTSTTLPNGQPAVDLSGLTADQEFQAGLFCGSVKSNPYTPLPTPCPVGLYGSKLVSIPAPNSQNDDHNPQRIAPRNLFDVAIRVNNLIKTDKYKCECAREHHQPDQQLRAVQLLVYVQRNALRAAAHLHRRDWISLLAGRPILSPAFGERVGSLLLSGRDNPGSLASAGFAVVELEFVVARLGHLTFSSPTMSL